MVDSDNLDKHIPDFGEHYGDGFMNDTEPLIKASENPDNTKQPILLL